MIATESPTQADDFRAAVPEALVVSLGRIGASRLSVTSDLLNPADTNRRQS